ncbi:hypothetical protein Ppa06_61510 [Planomonospora parontospora subsp. parontospora]|uniref:Uncharacterized protein n=2 Tax=Planomonospora parontospora TaxID=58119 RepID=A0AA37BFX7_9ACTN|nr:hypothetical protein [Planomonospora parontospora]GGK62474.1 hypothetical protein GCM10010126_22310 [Planomonospora parontospora]GII12353.1 hypothetical protein Ppa06_61510 [Planomonospora parontospora subsp. parontospora]
MIEIDPLRSVGPVLIGSSHEEAGQALRVWGEPVPYAPYPGALPLDWRINGGDTGIDAFVHCGSTGAVQAVEIFRDSDTRPRAQVLLLGVDVFSMPAGQVMEVLRERFEIEEEDDCGFTVPEISVGLWRSIVPGEDADEAERERYTCFESVLAARPGYYARPSAPEPGR